MIPCKSNDRWRMTHSVVLEGFTPQQNYKSLPAMVLCLIHKYRSIMNTKFINFKVQPFAFTYLLRWWIEQVFVSLQLLSPRKVLGTCYIFLRENWELNFHIQCVPPQSSTRAFSWKEFMTVTPSYCGGDLEVMLLQIWGERAVYCCLKLQK